MTSASNDLHHVAGIAKQMVKEFVMSNLAATWPCHLPSRAGCSWVASWACASLVDLEVERLVNNAYVMAKLVLTENIKPLHHLAYTMAENEVGTAEEFQMMVLLFNVKVCEYKFMGGDQNREHLPLFKSFPKDV